MLGFFFWSCYMGKIFNGKPNYRYQSSYGVIKWTVKQEMTHQPPAMIRWVEERSDTVEKATELCLSLLTGSSLKFTKFNSLEIIFHSKYSEYNVELWSNQEGWHPKHHMADVIGVGNISWYHHLTGPYRKIQTSQNSCENLWKNNKQTNN